MTDRIVAGEVAQAHHSFVCCRRRVDVVVVESVHLERVEQAERKQSGSQDESRKQQYFQYMRRIGGFHGRSQNWK